MAGSTYFTATLAVFCHKSAREIRFFGVKNQLFRSFLHAMVALINLWQAAWQLFSWPFLPQSSFFWGLKYFKGGYGVGHHLA
ncbi:hypothetical protein [Aeromonas australiensis]|uniref:hypothetical protein n=1 Tax=Aeromonas australiensis TaxID=1114880 RepID=UPI0012E0117E|nr:hypothetical protein [Aeromonas australiensis]